jgi:hypothetical protein
LTSGVSIGSGDTPVSMPMISFSDSVSASCVKALRSLRVYSWKLTSSQHWALLRW